MNSEIQEFGNLGIEEILSHFNFCINPLIPQFLNPLIPKLSLSFDDVDGQSP